MKQEINGWLLIDKPVGISSNQVLGKLKRLFKPKKIGFVGTLDPLASGVLPVAFGEATKTIQFVENVNKTYEFSIKWGEHRDTYDGEGDVIDTSDIQPLDAEIDANIGAFIGKIAQTPPKYSAIKINGKRAYDLARQDCDFEIQSREITIFDLKRSKPTINDETFLCVHCSKGTYVRSLAVDLATSCGALGYVKHLRRLKSGAFEIDQTISLAFLENMLQNIQSVLLPVETALDDIPAYALTEQEVEHLRFGLTLAFSEDKASAQSGLYKAFYNDHLIAVLELDPATQIMKSKRIFNLYNQ